MSRAPLRVWLAPNDSLNGRVWVWHVRGGGRYGWGWSPSWRTSVDYGLAYMRRPQ